MRTVLALATLLITGCGACPAGQTAKCVAAPDAQGAAGRQVAPDNPRPGVEGCEVCALVACLSDGGDAVTSMRLLVLHSSAAKAADYLEGTVTVRPSGSMGGVASKLDVAQLSAKTLLQQKLVSVPSELKAASAWKSAQAEVELVWTAPGDKRSEAFTIPAGIGKCD